MHLKTAYRCIAIAISLVSGICVQVHSQFHSEARSSSSHVMRHDAPLYTEFQDRGFPFLECSVDFRKTALKGTKDNLVVRGIILPLDDDVFVCFDTELLRVAAIWKGDFLTPDSMSMLSYSSPLTKISAGQERLPQPRGDVLFQNSLYPGWSLKGQETFTDPRSRWIDENELGRGPLEPDVGKWLGVEDAGEIAKISYEVYGNKVSEYYRVIENQGRYLLQRSIELQKTERPLSLALNDYGSSKTRDTSRIYTSAGSIRIVDDRFVVCDVLASEHPSQYNILYSLDGEPLEPIKIEATSHHTIEKKGPRWSNSITTEIERGKEQGAFAVDELRFPYPNPWERRIRSTDILFRSSGEALVLTFDGDVYSITGLGSSDTAVEWRRIAAGFNEPQSFCLRDEDIFVFSRNGVVRLVDNDGDGETDFYENFCNRFLQSANTRDFPTSIVCRSDGSFLIAKGGVPHGFESPHLGRVLRISADGHSVSTFAHGLRNGYIDIHPDTGLVLASDQQGHWVPSTPLIHITEGGGYGFKPAMPKGATSIDEPILWIPHRAAQSGIGKFWADDPRMGPLENALIYIDYAKPRILKVLTNTRAPLKQAAAIPMDIEFEVPLLDGALNPRDGLAYFAGFQIWDSDAKRLEGICRLRPLQKADTLPTEAKAYAEGVMLSFSRVMTDGDAKHSANYAASSWEYLRSEKYGSGQYKANGLPGIDDWDIHAAIPSRNGKSVFLAIKDLRPVMQFEVRIETTENSQPIYFTLDHLPPFSEKDHGFEQIDFETLFQTEPVLRSRKSQNNVVSIDKGRDLYNKYGCTGCHSTDGSTAGKTGPSFKGLYQSKRHLVDGTVVIADESYLKESLLYPSDHVVKGYETGEAAMPSFSGILNDSDIQSIVLFMKSLK